MNCDDLGKCEIMKYLPRHSVSLASPSILALSLLLFGAVDAPKHALRRADGVLHDHSIRSRENGCKAENAG